MLSVREEEEIKNQAFEQKKTGKEMPPKSVEKESEVQERRIKLMNIFHNFK
jgi:hypothetical protein